MRRFFGNIRQVNDKIRLYENLTEEILEREQQMIVWGGMFFHELKSSPADSMFLFGLSADLVDANMSL